MTVFAVIDAAGRLYVLYADVVDAWDWVTSDQAPVEADLHVEEWVVRSGNASQAPTTP